MDKRFDVSEVHRCAFHISQKWKISFEKYLKKYLTPRRQQATEPDQIIVNHCRKGMFHKDTHKFSKSA